VFLISGIIDAAAKTAGKRANFQVDLWKLSRYKNFEAEYFIVDTLVNPSLLSIDVGANEGYYAGRLAQLCESVICFEPIPWMAQSLREKMPRNVDVRQQAVSDRVGRAQLRIPYAGDVEMHGTSTIEAENPLEAATHEKIVDCECVTLDSAVDRKVGFIKIDVEGHELAVLRGAEGIIRRDRPILLVESETRHSAGAPQSIISYLAALGYDGLCMFEGKLVSLNGFDNAIHQSPSNIVGPKKVGPYINNFIFIPRIG
jgi:FkbM family methyltransferase